MHRQFRILDILNGTGPLLQLEMASEGQTTPLGRNWWLDKLQWVCITSAPQLYKYLYNEGSLYSILVSIPLGLHHGMSANSPPLSTVVLNGDSFHSQDFWKTVGMLLIVIIWERHWTVSYTVQRMVLQNNHPRDFQLSHKTYQQVKFSLINYDART